MRKRNLLFPLVVTSLFMPSIEALESTNEFNSLENENNIYEAVDILIAEGSGNNKSKQQAENLENNEEKAKESARQRKEDNSFPTEKEKIKNIVGFKITKVIIKDLINYIQDKININPKISHENNEFVPFSRCGAFTMKAIEAYENNNIKRARAYSKLSNKSINREIKILKENKNQLNQKGIDEKEMKFIELSLRSLNNLIDDNYEQSNQYLLEAINLEKKASSPLNKLVPFTKLLSGDINKGCSDLEDLIVDGTIDIEDFDENFPIEDICIFPDL